MDELKQILYLLPTETRKKLKWSVNRSIRTYYKTNLQLIKEQRTEEHHKRYRKYSEQIKKYVKNWNTINRDYFLLYRRKRLTFRGKRIHMKEIVRQGKCVFCKRTIESGQIKTTNLHHLKYDKNNPSWYTIELCPRCHNMIHRGTISSEFQRMFW